MLYILFVHLADYIYILPIFLLFVYITFDKKDACLSGTLSWIILLVLLFAVVSIRLLFLQLLIKPVIVLAVLFDIIQCFVRFYIIFFKVVSLSAHTQTAGQGCR